MPNTFDLDSWVIGYELGFAGNPMPTLSVSYLYNGAELPPLPKEDKTVYPYAMISYTAKNSADSKMMARVYIMTEPCVRGSLTTGIIMSGACIKYALVEDLATWEEWGGFLGLPEYMSAANTWCFQETLSGDDIQIANGFFKPTWSNFDIINQSDGSVYFAKSDPPVPVYK